MLPRLQGVINVDGLAAYGPHCPSTEQRQHQIDGTNDLARLVAGESTHWRQRVGQAARRRKKRDVWNVKAQAQL